MSQHALKVTRPRAKKVVNPILVIIMAILRSRCGHYVFARWFLLSIFFFFLA